MYTFLFNNVHYILALAFQSFQFTKNMSVCWKLDLVLSILLEQASVLEQLQWFPAWKFVLRHFLSNRRPQSNDLNFHMNFRLWPRFMSFFESCWLRQTLFTTLKLYFFGNHFKNFIGDVHKLRNCSNLITTLTIFSESEMWNDYLLCDLLTSYGKIWILTSAVLFIIYICERNSSAS